jgi:hypothetical protein
LPWLFNDFAPFYDLPELFEFFVERFQGLWLFLDHQLVVLAPSKLAFFILLVSLGELAVDDEPTSSVTHFWLAY